MRDPATADSLIVPKRNATAAVSGSRLVRRLAAAGLMTIALTSVVVAARAQEHGAMSAGHGAGGPVMETMFGGRPEHLGHMVDHLLDGLGATEAQRGQIRQITLAAAADLKQQREAGRGLRNQAAQIFTAPNVDASAAEGVRQQMLSQQDQSSKRILQAMLDISRVLTPEQRAQLGARMRDRQAVMQDRMQRLQPGAPQPRSTP